MKTFRNSHSNFIVNVYYFPDVDPCNDQDNVMTQSNVTFNKLHVMMNAKVLFALINSSTQC